MILLEVEYFENYCIKKSFGREEMTMNKSWNMDSNNLLEQFVLQ